MAADFLLGFSSFFPLSIQSAFGLRLGKFLSRSCSLFVTIKANRLATVKKLSRVSADATSSFFHVPKGIAVRTLVLTRQMTRVCVIPHSTGLCLRVPRWFDEKAPLFQPDVSDRTKNRSERRPDTALRWTRGSRRVGTCTISSSPATDYSMWLAGLKRRRPVCFCF